MRDPQALIAEITRTAVAAADRPAFECGADVLSYQSLLDQAEALSKALAAAGAEPQQILAFDAPTGSEFLVVLLAGLSLKMLVAPVAAELVPYEKQQFLAAIKPQFYLTRAASTSQLPGSADSVQYGERSWTVVRASEPLDQRIAARCQAGGFIRFTSGTTGAAKGVVISAESARERIVAAEYLFQLQPAERVLCLLALPYHFVVSVLQFLRAGATIVRPANTSPSAIVRCFEEAACEVVYAAPFHFDLLVGSAQRSAACLRLLVSTSTTLRGATAARAEEKFQLPVTDSYGLIEVGIPVAGHYRGTTLVGGIGRVVPPYEAAVKNHHGVVSSGVGSLLLRGPGMFDAYLAPFQLREEVLFDSWFCTGDLAEIDAEGSIRLLGRSNSAIHVGGFKVFPEEVEAVLLSHESVLEAQVEGVPHSSFGSTIHAKIVLQPEHLLEEEPLRRYCRAQLGALRTPHSFEVVDAVPRTTTGKVLRRRTVS